MARLRALRSIILVERGELEWASAEAARAVCVSPTTIKQEIAAGRLLIRKVGRRTLIRREDLELWLDGLPGRV